MEPLTLFLWILAGIAAVVLSPLALGMCIVVIGIVAWIIVISGLLIVLTVAGACDLVYQLFHKLARLFRR